MAEKETISMIGLEGGNDPAPPIRLETRPYALAGLAVVIMLFGALGSWSAFAMLDSAILAPGVVTVQSKRKTVQHLEGGSG